jgi:hypothetical protein
VSANAIVVVGAFRRDESMLRKFGLVCVFALSLLGNVTDASAFSPAPMMGASPAVDGLLRASFFGRPYPYGYTGWARCTHYVEVQTAAGVRLRRVRVCR